jgi:hypothetical protein
MIKDICFNDPGSPFLEEETSAAAGYSAAISGEYKTAEAAKRSCFLCFHVTVPPYLADEIFVGLRRLGKDVTYLRFTHAGHWKGDWQ